MTGVNELENKLSSAYSALPNWSLC